jgi:hypothetical protein
LGGGRGDHPAVGSSDLAFRTSAVRGQRRNPASGCCKSS